MQNEDEPNFIGSAEACARLDIDRSTLIRWVQLGHVHPAMKLPGPRGAYLFDPLVINKLVIDRGQAAAS